MLGWRKAPLMTGRGRSGYGSWSHTSWVLTFISDHLHCVSLFLQYGRRMHYTELQVQFGWISASELLFDGSRVGPSASGEGV